MEDDGYLPLLLHCPAVLLIEIDSGNDHIGNIAFDLCPRGCAVLHRAVRDSRCLGMLVVRGRPFLRGGWAGPTMRREFVNDKNVAGSISGKGRFGISVV